MNSDLSAVVVAAGQSSRFNSSLGKNENIQKALYDLEGLPLIGRTLLALSVLPLRELAVVISSQSQPQFESALSQVLPESLFSKIKWVEGGARRQDSVRHGLKSLNSCSRVLIHDAARPFLNQDFLIMLNERSKEVSALIPAVPSVDTLKEVDSNGKVVRTANRNSFVRVQTPQFFRFDLIYRIHAKHAGSSQEFTDDAAMVEAEGEPVWTCAGSLKNIKVTTIEDLSGKGINHGSVACGPGL